MDGGGRVTQDAKAEGEGEGEGFKTAGGVNGYIYEGVSQSTSS